MSTPANFPDTPEEDAPRLAQVDPPGHGFLKTIVIAAVVMCVIAAIYWRYIQSPPPYAGQVLSESVYPIHSTLTGAGGEGMQGAADSYDQVIVFAQVKVHNQGKIPLYIRGVSQALVGSDNSRQISRAASPEDIRRVMEAFPETVRFKTPLFPTDTTLEPGQTVDGLAVFNYPVTQEQWNRRRSSDVSVSFIHQKDLVLSSPR